MIITSGIYKNKRIITPDENITRPTLSKIRMSVFDILQSLIDFETSSFLDMFAGSGIMGLEALSRGFQKSAAIEKNNRVIKILKTNYKNTVKNNLSYKIYFGDSLKIAPKLTDEFDVIFIDPPYYSDIYEQSLSAIQHLSKDIIILEHVQSVNFTGFDILKQKKYGDKYLTVLRKIR